MMTTKDREILENIFKELYDVKDGSALSPNRLVGMVEHVKKCEGQSRTDKENELLTRTKGLLDRRMGEWEKANNKTMELKVCSKKDALAHRDSQDKSIEKYKALERWKKLSEYDKAFLKSCGMKP